MGGKTVEKINTPIYVVEERHNPTTDYYIVPALKVSGTIQNAVVLSKPPEKINKGATVIFVRYISDAWKNFVEQNKKKIRRIIYFMDDDLFNLKAIKELPLRYAFKIFSLAYIRKNWLIKNSATFVVSNEHLQKKYSQLNPSVLPPYPIFHYNLSDSFHNESENVLLFYYASACHEREMIWLHDIIKEILRESKNVSFEITGGPRIVKLYNCINGVKVIKPMKWKQYRSFLTERQKHIGLVPLLPSTFNKSRTYTKFFEISGCGAVGVYFTNSCYSKVVRNMIDGLFIDNKKDHWIESILSLINDRKQRATLYKNSLEKINKLKKQTEIIYNNHFKHMLLGDL